MKSILRALLFLVISGLFSRGSFGETAFAVGPDESHKKGKEYLLFADLPVVSVSKYAESISKAPGIVTVITAKEIEDFGATDLFEVLERAPSFQMLSSNVWLKNLASVRGDLDTHLDTRVLLLVDGRPVRDGCMGGWNNVVYSSFPLDMIERIEIARGPGSVLYGSNAFLASVNIITKNPEKDSVKASVSFGYGSFKTNTDTLNLWFNKGGFDFSTGAQYVNSEGWKFKSYDRDHRYGEMNNGETNLGLTSKASYSPNNGLTEMTFSTYYADYNNDFFAISPIVWSQKGDQDGKRFFGDLGVSHKIGEDWLINLNATENYNNVWLNYPPTLARELNSDQTYELHVGGRLWDKLNLTVGGLREHRTKPKNTNSAIVTRYRQHYCTQYDQLAWDITTSLTLIGGVQFLDPNCGKKDTVSRLGMVYQFNDKIGTKLLYGQAYRSPFPAEQLSNVPGVLIGNPGLLPEKIDTYDWQVSYRTDKTNLALTLFRNGYNRLITRSGVTYVNSQTADNVNGAELEWKRSLIENLYLEGSAMAKSEKLTRMYSPDYMFKSGLSWGVSKDFTASLFYNLFGAPRSAVGPAYNPKAREVNLVDLNLIYKLPMNENIKLNLFVKNLLDQDYYFVEFNKLTQINTLLQQPGRGIYAKVALGF